MKYFKTLYLLFLMVVTLTSCNSTIYLTTAKTSTESSAIAKTTQYYGSNGQINFNRVSYNDSSLIQTIDSLHLDMLRHPGGTYGEQYQYLTDTPSLYSLAMVKAGAHIPRIIFVLNTATSTLSAQLDMLKLAYSLHLFTDTLWCEIGNEWVEQHDDNFLNKCATWANALKSQYGNVVQIGIPGGAPNKWNSKVLSRIPYAHLVDHYSNPNNYTVNGITDTAYIAKMMDADKAHYFGGIPVDKVWVTEFNLQVGNNTTPYFANDAQKALAVAFMFRHFRSYGFPIILFHNICMAQENGMVNSDARGSYLSPTGWGFIQFKQLIQLIQ